MGCWTSSCLRLKGKHLKCLSCSRCAPHHFVTQSIREMGTVSHQDLAHLTPSRASWRPSRARASVRRCPRCSRTAVAPRPPPLHALPGLFGASAAASAARERRGKLPCVRGGDFDAFRPQYPGCGATKLHADRAVRKLYNRVGTAFKAPELSDLRLMKCRRNLTDNSVADASALLLPETLRQLYDTWRAVAVQWELLTLVMVLLLAGT